MAAAYRERDKPRQGGVARSLAVIRSGAVGFIDWLDLSVCLLIDLSSADVLLDTKVEIKEFLMRFGSERPLLIEAVPLTKGALLAWKRIAAVMRKNPLKLLLNLMLVGRDDN